MAHINSVALKKAFVKLEVKETALVLAASVALPFLVHLIPPLGEMPVGARLIPMFYAPFIAIVLFRPHVALITGLLAPTSNFLLTGHPASENIFVLTLELVLFCIAAYLIRRKWKRFWGVAALAYLAAVLGATCLLGRISLFMQTMVNSLTGIGILTLINIFLLRQFKTEK